MPKVLISDKMDPRAAQIFKARGIEVDESGDGAYRWFGRGGGKREEQQSEAGAACGACVRHADFTARAAPTGRSSAARSRVLKNSQRNMRP